MGDARRRAPCGAGRWPLLPLAAALGALLLGPGPARALPIVEGELFRMYYRGELRALAAVAHLPAERRVSGTGAVPAVETHAFEAVRLAIWGAATPFVSFELAYEHTLDLAPPAASPVPTFATPPPAPQRFFDLDWRLHGSDDLVWRHEFDRLNVGLHLPVADGLHVVLGRQLVHWGFGRIWFPADRFSPPRPIELYREHGPGVDAVQLRMAAGDSVDLRAVILPTDAARELVALARLELRLGPVELAVTGGDDHHRGLFGLGARWDLGLAQLEGEALWYLDPDAADHAAAVLGATFQLPLGITATLEFAHDGAGVGSPARYPSVWAAADWRAARLVGVGRWYGGLRLGARPWAEVDVGLTALLNLEDQSAAFHFHLSAAVSDDAWLGVSAVTALGATGAADSAPESEFGIAPHTYLLDLRLYF
jgi:hypothetical protein